MIDHQPILPTVSSVYISIKVQNIYKYIYSSNQRKCARGSVSTKENRLRDAQRIHWDHVDQRPNTCGICPFDVVTLFLINEL